MIDRHDLTDAEWALLQPFLPDRAVARRGAQWLDHRQVINGLLWRTRTGSPWRDLPAEFGNWQTGYLRHRLCSMDGIWGHVLDALRRGCDQAEGRDWTVGADSLTAPRTSTRRERHARRRPSPQRALPNYRSCDQDHGREALGRSAVG